MQRLWPRTREEQLFYHTNRNDAPEFDKGQPGRIDLARFLVDKILKKDLTKRPLTIVELGCGAGDITGPYSGERLILNTDHRPKAVHVSSTTSTTARIDNEIIVHGYDVVPVAQETCARRWPDMVFHLGPIEEAEPIECDLLVMCEFLEHVHDPWAIVKAWMPKAHFAIIGHPLDEPNPPLETGHIWSYTLADWYDWFEQTGFHVWEQFRFPMGGWPNMVMGHGSRKDLPPYPYP